MKTIASLLFILLLSSCASTYFYTTLDTDNKAVEKVDNGDFLYETDSLWIAYCFKGKDAPMQITIFNKLNVPLYIDWQRSALIMDNTAYTYAGDKMNFSGWSEQQGSALSDHVYTNSYSIGRFEGNVSLPKHIVFIPPQTMISHIPLHLYFDPKKIDSKQYRKAQFGDVDNEVAKVDRVDFSKDDSPMTFRSYLTIYSDQQQPMYFDQSFYVSRFIKAKGFSPNRLPASFIDRGDMFYIENPANQTGLWVGLSVAGVAGMVLLLDSVDMNTEIETPTGFY